MGTVIREWLAYAAIGLVSWGISVGVYLGACAGRGRGLVFMFFKMQSLILSGCCCLLLGAIPVHSPTTRPATTQAVARAPRGFFAYSVSSSEIDLYWVHDETPGLKHNIYRSTAPDMKIGPNTRIAVEIRTPSFRDTGLQPNTTYYYRITAVKDRVESDASRVDSDTTFPSRDTDSGERN